MMVSQGVLSISADKSHLYYGDHGLSPSSVYKINVTNPTSPTLAWESPHGPASNGRDLEFTQDGNFFSYVSVVGATNEYAIAKQRTSDMAIVGRFQTGAFPEEIVYSPNGAFAYTSIGTFPSPNTSKAVVWNANTFAQVGEITMPGIPHEMFIPGDGRYLFASVDSDAGVDSLYVYETGRLGNRNVGDLNENNLLDPGESWTFKHQITVQPGQFAVGLSAIGIANGSEAVTANSTAYFKAVAPFTEVAAQAAENVMGLGITQLPHDPYVGPVTVSDTRFLVSGRYLDLKPDQFLTVAQDDGIVVEIRTVEATPRLLFRVTIDVVANERPWQRPFDPQDIDADGYIIPQDALIIINHLHRMIGAPSSELGPRPYANQFYLDVNGDGHLTAADALAVINWLHANPVSFAGEGEENAAAAADDNSSSFLLLDPEEPVSATSTSVSDDLPATLTCPPATVATDWVFSLIETEPSTTRARRTAAGVSSDTAPWWPADEQDNRARSDLL